jgi:hypothetical protein
VTSEQDVPLYRGMEDKLVTTSNCKPVYKVMTVRASDPKQNGGIERRARQAVAEHCHFRGRTDKFEFVCREDVLQVRGAVPSFYLKQLLQDALKGLQGVRWIDNQVAVVSFDELSRTRDNLATCIA